MELEQVKEHFKNAKEVRCLIDNHTYEINSNMFYINSIGLHCYDNFNNVVLLYSDNGKKIAKIISYKEEKEDNVVTSVIEQFKERSKRGIEKYGTTLHENNTDDFLQHLKEELMDGILYIQKLQDERK